MAIGSFNKVIIGGRLGRDPEIHTFEGGDRVARVSIATTEQWMSGGARQEKTDWHTPVLFKKAAVTFAERNLKKGDLVIVEGRLENRSYQKEGQTHHVTEIAVPRGPDGGSARPGADGESRRRPAGTSGPRQPDRGTAGRRGLNVTHNKKGLLDFAGRDRLRLRSPMRLLIFQCIGGWVAGHGRGFVMSVGLPWAVFSPLATGRGRCRIGK
jgi:single-strand DNA-binding protein